MKWKLRRPFLKTSSRRPQDLLKTSLRLFLAKSKDHLETMYGLSIYTRVKLHTYYHTITRQTNCISLNELNTLKHENNAEVMCISPFQKRLLIRKLNFENKTPSKKKKERTPKTLVYSKLMLERSFLLLVILEEVLQEIEKSWNQLEHWY